MSFAKGVTSGYLPLGGIQISDTVREVIMNAPANEVWMHAYTYSGHPTCAAVALKNIELLQSMDLADHAAAMGRRLLDGLNGLAAEFPEIGDVRGQGLICAIELVADRETKAPSGTGAAVRAAAIEGGLYTRAIGDILAFAPPLIISPEEVDQMVEITGQGHCRQQETWIAVEVGELQLMTG